MKWIPRIPMTFETSWRVISTGIVIVAALALLLFSQLGSLLPGYSQTEIETARANQSLAVILDNPINAPFKLTALAISEITDRPIFSVRLASAIFGTLTILLFYFGVRNWHSARISFLATVLFGTSAWFLHSARFGSADIMVPFSILLLATAGYWVVRRESSSIFYGMVLLAIGASLFVPGLIWFIVGGLLIRHGKDIRNIFKHFRPIQISILTILLIVGVMTAIGIALASQPSIALQLLALPSNPPNLLDFAQNLALIPFSMFVAVSENPEIWLGSLPYLDIFTAAMFILGLYYYFKYRSLDRARLLAIFLVFGAVLVALGSSPISLLLPGVYIAAAGGIALLLSQWMTVFPRNPLAQSLGIGLVTLAVIVSGVYNLRAYFVAWPKAPETRATYQLQRDNLIQ